MLPPMNNDYNETPDLTTDDLNDQAIELLYSIVRRAQTSPDASSRRALFTAYEEVLAERGLGPEDDSVLHRFLHRMQRDERVEERLDQRFQRALAELGIDVDINEDGEGIENTADLKDAVWTEKVGVNGGGRERSGSFDSFFDGSADKIPGTADVVHEQPPRGRKESSGAAQNKDVARWAEQRSWSDTEAQSYSQHHLPIRTRVNGHANRRATSEQYQPNHRRGGSVSSRGSLRIRRNEPTATSQYGQEYDEAYESEHSAPTANITDEINLSNVQIPGINVPIPDPGHPQTRSYVPEPFRPSDTRLLDDAEAFEQQRMHSLARACLQKWRDRLKERSERDAEMDRMAIAFDRKILMKGLLSDLKVEAQNRRNNQETERFFGRLEGRAEKARSLFLLTKSFTHWAQCTEDEVQRTSVARRHILRTKFFKGWRDITAVNEFKIQQFVLRNFLEKWRRRALERRVRHEAAMNMHDSNLLRKYQRHWFFQYCDIAAPAWHDVRLKRSTFGRWREITSIIKERDDWALDRREREVARKSFALWRQKSDITQTLQPQADDFRRRILLSTALFSLRKQSHLAPLVAQFRTKADDRLVAFSFQTWRRSAQLSRQARNVDRGRVMRNAWTAWNDRLRIKALEERINDRVLVETMYKWTLASRVSLFQRVHDRNLKESIFLAWTTKANEQVNTLDSAERRFAQFKRAQILRSCLRKIESATAQKRAEEFAVNVQFEQKLKQRIFEKFLDKREHLQQLNRWSDDAHYYVLVKGSLKRWNNATQHARRNRRRELYAQVRRTVKLNMVRKAFGIWKAKADHIEGQAQQADRIVHNRTLENSRVLLTHWHVRFSTIHDHNQQISQQYKDQLQARYLGIMSQRLQVLKAMETEAIALRQESTEIAVTSAFKKLSWRLWNVRRREETALALHQRNFEKHVKAMLRFWLEQTVERAAQRPISPTPTRRSRGERNDDDDDHDGGDEEDGDDAGDDTRRLEAWTAFDEGALDLPDLDLSLSLSPQNQPPPSLGRATLISVHRPQTYPQPQSVLRPGPRPPPIPEDMAFDDPSAFWTSTPMPPQVSNTNVPPSHQNTSFIAPATGKPGYLKTPSKRSIARNKRSELPFPGAGPGSPDKRFRMGLDRRLGVMSAPPVPAARETGGLQRGGVTSFEKRLRQGGFVPGTGVTSTAGSVMNEGGRGRDKGRARVDFGDVSHIG